MRAAEPSGASLREAWPSRSPYDADAVVAERGVPRRSGEPTLLHAEKQRAPPRPLRGRRRRNRRDGGRHGWDRRCRPIADLQPEEGLRAEGERHPAVLVEAREVRAAEEVGQRAAGQLRGGDREGDRVVREAEEAEHVLGLVAEGGG